MEAVASTVAQSLPLDNWFADKKGHLRYLKRGLHWQIYSTFFLTPILLTQNINVKNKYKCNYESTLFLAPQHIQSTTQYFDFESKNCTGTDVDQTARQRKTKNVPKMKFEMGNQVFMFCLFLNWVIKKVCFLLLFSLLNLVKDIWSKFSKYFQHIQCGVKCRGNCTIWPCFKDTYLGDSFDALYWYRGASNSSKWSLMNRYKIFQQIELVMKHNYVPAKNIWIIRVNLETK